METELQLRVPQKLAKTLRELLKTARISWLNVLQQARHPKSPIAGEFLQLQLNHWIQPLDMTQGWKHCMGTNLGLEEKTTYKNPTGSLQWPQKGEKYHPLAGTKCIKGKKKAY